MKMKRWFFALTAMALSVSLCACGADGTGVYVQSVASLSGMGGIAPGDRFAGIVVSEHVAEVEKDSEKTIAELLVREGDDVSEGDPLFSYDTEQLQLTLDKQRLELEQLNATIENYKSQITELEKDRDRAYGTDKLQYTVQIQSTQVDLKEAELNVKTKETEVARSEEILENATVMSPVTGRIQAISENGTDNYGNPLPYITIQQAGSYRVKGTLGELQRGGIMEGSQMKILSRTDPDQYWTGMVSLVDYENPTQENGNNMYGMVGDEMTTSSKYPFYIELESTQGLILGQHVYIELAVEEEEMAGVPLDMAFIAYEEDGTPYVWAENKGKLEKRPITLGDMDPMTGMISVLEGLTEEDYIAFPDPAVCREGAATTRSMPEQEEPAGDMAVAEGEVG